MQREHHSDHKSQNKWTGGKRRRNNTNDRNLNNGGIGNSLGATKLFEAQVIPALLHNCESWIGLNETHISDLQDFQDKLMRKLLRLSPSTPKAKLHWDSGVQMMKRQIAEKKLLFLRKTMEREDSNKTRKALLNETVMGLKGLGY